MDCPQMTMAEYQAVDAISKSRLDLIHRSPAHYREELENPTPPTPAMIWGTAFHSLVLEPDVFHATYAVWDNAIDRRTKEGKEAWADWEIENAGKVSIAKPDMQQLSAMRDAVFAHTKLATLLEDGISECCLFWELETEHGIVRCKARPDFVSEKYGLMLDLKSCLDARPDAFSRSCWNYRYHVQNAFYLDAWALLSGEKLDGFMFGAVEKDRPNGIALYLADETMTDQGRREYWQDLELYAKCAASNEWPGYTTDTQSILLPRWAQEDY